MSLGVVGTFKFQLHTLLDRPRDILICLAITIHKGRPQVSDKMLLTLSVEFTIKVLLFKERY